MLCLSLGTPSTLLGSAAFTNIPKFAASRYHHVAPKGKSSMSIYTTPLSQLSTPDLQELLNEGAVENARLEFKLEAPSRDETLKKLSSFANTFGGFMVIGASARSADGRVEALQGVDPIAGYKQRVVQWSFDGASPPLTVEVSDAIPAPAGDGKVCYVVYTLESDVAPHFLNSRKGVWVRTDEFSGRFEARLANDNELRHLLDRRRLILERRDSMLARARKRFATYAGRILVDDDHNATESGPRLELCVVPRFPARPLCEEGNLKPLITSNYLNWRQSGFPNPSSGVISQHESAIVLRAAGNVSMHEANIWGMLFYGVQLMYESHENVTGVHLHHLLGCLSLFVRHADLLLRAMGYSGPTTIVARLDSIQGVRWLHGLDGPWASVRPPGPELDNDVTISIPATTEVLREKPDAVTIDLLRYIFFSLNWSDLIDTEEKLNELVLRGYDYNFWPRSVGLKV